jgi:pimeloyl-ACP methyl ester carboxylesterase
MPQISVNGVDAYYRDEGGGIPVVLGHSSTASSGQWRELFKRVSGRYRLVAPDHIGYGRTPSYSSDIPLMELEIAIVEALVRLISQPVHLVGHSFGGSILARVAVRMPGEVRSLTLVEPTLFYLLAPSGRVSEHAEIKAVADRVIRYVGKGDADEAARGSSRIGSAPAPTTRWTPECEKRCGRAWPSFPSNGRRRSSLTAPRSRHSLHSRCLFN